MVYKVTHADDGITVKYCKVIKLKPVMRASNVTHQSFSWFLLHCAVPENIHTPPTEGIGISWGWGGSVRPKNLNVRVHMNVVPRSTMNTNGETEN